MRLRTLALLVALTATAATAFAQTHDDSSRTHDSSSRTHDNSPRPTGHTAQR